MHKKLSRLIEPNLQPYFFLVALFILAAIPIEPMLAVAEAVALLLVYLYYRNQSRKRRRSMMQYMETVLGGADTISRSSMLNTPLPVVIFRSDNGEVLWTNDSFLELSEQEQDIFDMTIGELVPDLDVSRLLSSGGIQDNVQVGGRIYQVYGTACRIGSKSTSQDQVVSVYFVDVTEAVHLRQIYEATRPVVSVMVLDNYEELIKAGGEAAKSAVLAQVDERLTDWVTGSGGLLRRFDRDRYLFICDEACFDKMTEQKFPILETIHSIVSEDGVNATLSIGAGKDCDSYDAAFQAANKAIEMALSRGGDQAVVKDSLDFQYYGGRSKSTEKRTKVKSRVMAKALGDLIADSSEVYAMGHEYADMDSVGAAAGICCAARKLGKKVRIVIDLEKNNSQALVRRLREMPEYEDIFISGNDAFIHAQPGALLVVVDTNRPDMVESRQLLDACNRVAVIDHHRRASSYIESAALNFHEPYASSASELVTELLQYMVEPADLLRGEAEALMAGIVLDTKNFMMRTGGRTFEAAAFLRRSGADMTEVRRYFQSDLPSMVKRYDIIRSAEMVHEDIALAVAEDEVTRVTAAKAADDLLSLKGIQASFVLYRMGENVSLSARSLGEINVQIIVEKLGGGGNSTTAGGMVPNASLPMVKAQLLDAIDAYYKQ